MVSQKVDHGQTRGCNHGNMSCQNICIRLAGSYCTLCLWAEQHRCRWQAFEGISFRQRLELRLLTLPHCTDTQPGAEQKGTVL